MLRSAQPPHSVEAEFAVCAEFAQIDQAPWTEIARKNDLRGAPDSSSVDVGQNTEEVSLSFGQNFFRKGQTQNVARLPEGRTDDN